MHINTRSIIFQPNQISENLTKLKFSESLHIKFFTVDEIISSLLPFQQPQNNLQENTILQTPNNNTSSNNPNNNMSNLYSSTKYAANTMNNNRRRSTNIQNQNYSSLIFYNQISQNQSDLQFQRASLITNRKVSSNNGKNNNANNIIQQNNYLNTHSAKQTANLQNFSGQNNSPKYNSVNYVNNNNYTSKKNTLYNFLEFKISNFSEIFNKLIKENIMLNNSSSSNNNIISNTNNFFNINANIANNKNQNSVNNFINNTINNNHNQNTSCYTQNSNRNVNNNPNLNLKTRHTNIIDSANNALNNNDNNIINIEYKLNQNNDLQNYFYENNLNYQCFVDLLNNVNCSLDGDNIKIKYQDYKKTKFLICLAKCNKTHNITRWPIINYDILISPKKYFFVIEAEEALINNFIEDYKFVSEKLNKTDEDTFSIYNEFVNTKLKYELYRTKELENNNDAKLIQNLDPISANINDKNDNDPPLDNKILQNNINNNHKKNPLITNNYNNIDEMVNRKKSLKIDPGASGNNNNNKSEKSPNTVVTFNKNISKSPNKYEFDNSSSPHHIVRAFFVSRILPEGIQRGILLVYSNGFIHFKPVINNYKYSKRVLSKTAKNYLEIKLSKVESITKYRYFYRYKAINIFIFQAQRSKIFDFETEKDFTEFYEFMLKNCKNLDNTYNDIEHHTNLWRFGSLSNFEYLMYLNSLASRSFSDLTQYPIFPWIISNYEESEEIDLTDAKNFRDLSKPIGALTQYKLERFQQNFTEMKKQKTKNLPPYLYSEHYSNPAHIIYFLVRSHPQFQMKFKSGSMGPPDRLFNSVRDCWSYILNINNEVKELIPEFYSGSGDFLVNLHGLFLGETSSGATVNDVNLPKWAKSPSHFISVCKSALESKYVSSNLHLWIDLIFGCKQKNESAIAANNVFYYMTYENAIEKSCDEEFRFENDFKRQAFYTQLSEYGQVPKQLFDKPHPAKKAFSIYSSNYFTSNPATNTQEEILIKIELLIKENKRLEEQSIRLEREKMEEKEMLIRSQEEVEIKRNEKIKKLKE